MSSFVNVLSFPARHSRISRLIAPIMLFSTYFSFQTEAEKWLINEKFHSLTTHFFVVRSQKRKCRLRYQLATFFVVSYEILTSPFKILIPKYMSPNDPLPIFLTNRYLLLTTNSLLEDITVLAILLL